MLRESLFKRFPKRKYAVGGDTPEDANPMPIVLPGNELLNTNKDDPRKLEFGPEAQKRQDAAWGTTSSEPNIQRPKSVYDTGMYNIPSYNMPTEEQKVSKQDELTKEQERIPSEPTTWDKTKDYLKDNWQGLGMNVLAGVSGVLNYNDDIRKTDELNRSIQQRDTKPLEDYNYMYGRTTSGGTRYQGIVMAKQGAQIQARQNTPNYALNNVEIEGGEYIILPDGSSEIATGPAHSQTYNVDGQPQSGTNTNLPQNTLVFSNNMKPADFKKMSDQEKMAKVGAYLEKGGKMNDLDFSTMFKYGGKSDQNKTFAQIAKRYDTTYEEKILNNPFSKPEDRQAALLNKKKKDSVKAQLFRDQQFMNGQSNGEPQEAPQMSKGGINNPGFQALPGYVQAKITANMEDGGKKDDEYYAYQKDGKQYKTKVKRSEIKSKADAKNVGDYYEEDGVLKRVSAKRSGLPEYKGEDIGKVFKGNQEVANEYAYLEQQIADPEVRAALVEKTRAAAKNKDYYTGKSGKTSKAYGQLADIDKMSDDEIINNFLELNKRNLALKARGVDLSKVADPNDPNSVTNKRLAAEFKDAGIPLPEDFKKASLQQATYLGYRDLLNARKDNKLDPKLAEKIKNFDIGQRGVTDEPGTISGNRQISPIDAAYTNTTAGQYAKSTVDPIYDTEDIPGTYEETPEPGKYEMVTPERGKYTRMPYDWTQAVPGAYGLAQAQEVFPYAIPEVDVPYIKPQTLSVDSQLQSARNLGISALRAGADPNMVFAMTADNEAKAFQEKRNWDAQAQERADQTNFNAEFQGNMANAKLFNDTYNDTYATAKGNQSVARQNALTAMIENRAQYNKDENLKEFYYNNLVPSFNFDPNKPGFQMTPVRDPKTGVVSYVAPGSAAVTTETYSPGKKISGVIPSTGGKTTSTYSPSSTSNNAASSTSTPAAKSASNQLPANAPEMTAEDTESTLQRTNLNSNLPLSMQYGPKTSSPSGSPTLRTNLNSNLPLSMQFGPAPKPATPIQEKPANNAPATSQDELTKGMSALQMKKGAKMARGYYEEGGVVYEFMFNFDPKSIKTEGKSKRK